MIILSLKTKVSSKTLTWVQSPETDKCFFSQTERDCKGHKRAKDQSLKGKLRCKRLDWLEIIPHEEILIFVIKYGMFLMLNDYVDAQ